LKLDERLLTTFLEDPIVSPEIKKELISTRELEEAAQIRYTRVKKN